MQESEIKILALNLQEGDPPTLHPHKGIDLRSRCLFLALFEPLMRRQSDATLECAAAEGVDIDVSHTRYTFRIRNHCWSNGERVTSAHFADAWRLALSPQSTCLKADLFYLIKNGEKIKKGLLPMTALGLSTPDSSTLIVDLERPTPYFLDLTATSFFAPLYLVSDEEPTCFNGPFVVKTWDRDKELRLCANPQYWDRAHTHLDELRLTMIKDPMTALALYEQGELDLVGDPFSSLPFDSIPHLIASRQLKTRPISRIFYLLINTTRYPLHLPALRKALSLSIDRKALTEQLFLGETPSTSHLPTTLSMLGEQLEPVCLQEAIMYLNQALQELQLTRETLPKIILNYANLSGQKSLVQFLQDEWKTKLGIQVDVECLDWNMHVVNLRNKNYQMGTIHLTTLYQDPMFYFDLFKDKTLPTNYSAWEHPPFQALLERSEQALDTNTRQALLKQAEEMLMEEMPVIPLFTQNLQYLVHDDIDLVISDLGIYDFKQTRRLR